MTNTLVSLDEFKKIPFIDFAVVSGRCVPSTVFHDGTEWHMWLAVEGGTKVIKLPGRPTDSDYWGKTTQDVDEVSLRFFSFIQQRANWSPVVRSVHAIREDLHNVGALLGRMRHMHKSGSQEQLLSRMYMLDVETIFVVLRSIYDETQKIIACIWDKVDLTNKDLQKRKRSLPSSFADVVLKKGRQISPSQIADKYALPEQVARAYYQCGRCFGTIRTYRDKLVHFGGKVGWVTITEHGPVIRDTQYPFVEIIGWRKSCYLPNNSNNLVSLAYAMRSTTLLALCAIDGLIESVAKTIRLPDPIVPGFIYITKGPAIPELKRIFENENTESWL